MNQTITSEVGKPDNLENISINKSNPGFISLLSFFLSLLFITFIHMFVDLSPSGTTFPLTWAFWGVMLVFTVLGIGCALTKTHSLVFLSLFFLVGIPILLVLMWYGHTLPYYFLALGTGYVSVFLSKFLWKILNKKVFYTFILIAVLASATLMVPYNSQVTVAQAEEKNASQFPNIDIIMSNAIEFKDSQPSPQEAYLGIEDYVNSRVSSDICNKYLAVDRKKYCTTRLEGIKTWAMDTMKSEIIEKSSTNICDVVPSESRASCKFKTARTEADCRLHETTFDRDYLMVSCYDRLLEHTAPKGQSCAAQDIICSETTANMKNNVSFCDVYVKALEQSYTHCVEKNGALGCGSAPNTEFERNSCLDRITY